MPQNIPAIQVLKAGSTEGLSGPGFVTSYASLVADTTDLATRRNREIDYLRMAGKTKFAKRHTNRAAR